MGERGADGLSAEDVRIFGDGDRTVVFQLSRGGYTNEFRVKFPVVLYRGTYEEGRPYENGDEVTYAGALWICRVDETTARPGVGNKDWQLAAKKGMDGRTGPQGPPGKDGKDGKDGPTWGNK